MPQTSSIWETPAILGRKPRVLRHWLVHAHAAQIALLAVLLLLPGVIPGAVDTLLDAAYPPITRERLFGIIQTTRANPQRQSMGLLVHRVVDISAISSVLLLFFWQLPRSLRYARQHSLAMEKEAERLLPAHPARSVTCYRLSLEWTVDEDRERRLHNRISELKRTPPAKIAAPAPTREAAARDTRSAATQMFDAEQWFAHPRVVDQRYEIVATLGRGAMGTVFQARDMRLDRRVALKLLAPGLTRSPELQARFRQEARILARLSHANIVQIYDFLEADNGFWIAMELVEGTDLEQTLTAPLPTVRAGQLGRQMAEGLAYAHARGVVHRDLKPANLLLTADDTVKITDFGIAKLATAESLTHDRQVMGTPAYMSPEQADGRDTDQRTDIYSLGVILYRMLGGDLPFTGDASTLVAQLLSKEPPPLRARNPSLPGELDALVMRMLAKDPGQRPQAMAEIAEMLQTAAANAPS